MMPSLKRLHAQQWASRAVRKERRLFSEQGQALVELAVILPIFVVILIGAAEFARLEYARIEVATAARAGAEYGAQSIGTAANTSTMQSIAEADAADVPTLSAAASSYCVCSNGTSITCATASTLCLARVIQYVQVQASATVDPTFHLPGLPTTFLLTSQATMRVEQ